MKMVGGKYMQMESSRLLELTPCLGRDHQKAY